jgi:16S rRNA (guanine527-N7)-methyltransferase
MSSAESEAKFTNLLSANGVILTAEQGRLLDLYQALLLDWNSKINLVSRHLTPIELRFTHFIHSLSPIFFLSPIVKLRILDLGSGGGLPGIPLAILSPESDFLLVDATTKKAKAMDAMAAELGLRNVRVANARAEDLLRTGGVKEKFDIVLARAVGPLADLVQWSAPLLRSGSHILQWKQEGREQPIHLPALMAWKGGDLEAEIALMKNRTGRKAQVFPLVFPGSEEAGLEEKKLVVVEIPPAGVRR